jgi:hypothetical protein
MIALEPPTTPRASGHFRLRPWGLALCLTMGIAFAPGSASAQAEPHLVGVGFSTNLPHQRLGASVYLLGAPITNWGVYADVKRFTTSPVSRHGYTDEYTAEQVQELYADRLFRYDDVWSTLNAAVVRGVSPDLLLYLGAGASTRRQFHEYLDETQERGIGGLYTVEDPRASGTYANVLGGVFVRATPRIWIQLGVENVPRGATMGVGYVLPLR